ncbi:DEAD/DEAH box helicase [Acinetobacter calcoaceticus]|uniref:DEAD/DEAH box helicase n=1 Tax=Acinetobacter calcoaceticus TaxID=471 RepID=UPI003A870483
MKLAFWKRKKAEEISLIENTESEVKSFSYNELGIIFSKSQNAKTDADFYWQSLEEEELAYLENDYYVLPWEELFHILQDEEHKNVISLLNLPKQTSFRPVIKSEGGLSDSNFKITLDGWLNENNIKIKNIIPRIGGVLILDSKEYLLNEQCFRLAEQLKEFSRLENKDKELNQKYWAKIRNLAHKARANLDDFLRKTVVLAPEKLQFNLRKNLISNESIVEIQPVFDEAPSNWLRTFDQYNNVQDQYSISLSDGGIAHVVIHPQVKQVLNEIKKMPNRRVSGERAQAFLHNPFAQLGDDAIEVISAESFESSKQQAEIYTYILKIEKNYDELKHYISAKLELTENSEREQNPILLELHNLQQTFYFIQAYEKDSPFFMWAGYEIERNKYLDKQIQDLKNDLNEINKYQDELQAKQVLDLSNYSDRVIGIGEVEKLNSEFIKRDSGESEWLPQHLIDFEQQSLDENIELLEKCIKQAEQNNLNEVTVPNTDKKLSLEQAQSLLDQLRITKNKNQDEKLADRDIPQQKKKKDTLLIANNIDEAEFTKLRANRLIFDENNPPIARLPSSFRNQEFSLKQHQAYGVAWLQNLHRYAPEQVSGCLLADDMGLGKTLQLLCFIGEYLENAKTKKPVLVVAPVSLLENWEAEANRFFSNRFPKILSLYGDKLKERKIPKHLISSQLRDDHGITNLLEKDWRGNADIILTTYETMRDLEFSLAREDWSIMICDEAQKIKVPTAMVTKAAKAQKADFKIACTGTPVENSLNDLWCLFDFIQENLLGPLNQFGKTYRKSIENPDGSDEAVLLKLRETIAPQVLRRMKHDVADLPAKVEVGSCKDIEISLLQRQLYVDVVNRFKKLSAEGNQGAMLTSLHSMRMICAHPLQFYPGTTLNDSPKINWLISTLETIKQKNEKVIIFTEFRDIQVFLKRLLMERFGLNITTVNGDSNTSSKKGLTRQNLIDKFQEKSGFNIIILSTTAVGFGVNIQRANHVIHYTRSWNPAKEDQATDRAYRIGQDKEVFVYYPTVVADNFDTFEVKLDRLLSSKRELADDMLKPRTDIARELMDIID